MITLVTGKPKSGKSDMAEDLAVKSGCVEKYYIATMEILDDDGRARVEEHRKKREGKGFITLEIPTDIETAPGLMNDPSKSVVLLECVANLVGNRMHGNANTMWLMEQGEIGHKEFIRSVAESIMNLGRKVCELIVVSTSYEADENDEEETALYKKMLDAVNAELESSVDRVIRS